MEGMKVQETRLCRQVKDTHGLSYPLRGGPSGEWAQVNELVKERRELLLPSCCHISENREAKVAELQFLSFFSPVIYR